MHKNILTDSTGRFQSIVGNSNHQTGANETNKWKPRRGPACGAATHEKSYWNLAYYWRVCEKYMDTQVSEVWGEESLVTPTSDIWQYSRRVITGVPWEICDTRQIWLIMHTLLCVRYRPIKLLLFRKKNKVSIIRLQFRICANVYISSKTETISKFTLLCNFDHAHLTSEARPRSL